MAASRGAKSLNEFRAVKKYAAEATAASVRMSTAKAPRTLPGPAN